VKIGPIIKITTFHEGSSEIAFSKMRITHLQIAASVAAILPLSADPIANWKELNPNEAIVPIEGEATDSPTFGDGVTLNSAQQAWVAGRFGSVETPASVTLAVGETLTVTGTMVLTGGLDNSTQFRFAVQNDGGKFAQNDGNNWAGGWLHSIGTGNPADLWQARTDGPFISTIGDAIDLESVTNRTGLFDGDSVEPFAFSMTITRDSDTTVDVTSLITGGDGDLSEEYVKEDIETSLFTYNSLAFLFGGSSAVEQVALSDARYTVTSDNEEEIFLSVTSDGLNPEIDYILEEGKTYALETSLDLIDWSLELDDSLFGTGTFIDDLSTRFDAPLPSRVFYRLREINP
jgi:hypothetical protein